MVIIHPSPQDRHIVTVTEYGVEGEMMWEVQELSLSLQERKMAIFNDKLFSPWWEWLLYGCSSDMRAIVTFEEKNIISKILICLKSSYNFWGKIVLQILCQLLIDDACACTCKWKKTKIFYIYANVYDFILYYTNMIQLGYHSISWNPLTVSSGNLKCTTSISDRVCASFIYFFIYLLHVLLSYWMYM